MSKRLSVMIVATLLTVLPATSLGLAGASYTVIDPGSLQPDLASCAQGLNNVSQVVGLAWFREVGPFAYQRAFLWENGAMQDIGAFTGTNASVARRINDSGRVAGYSTRWSDARRDLGRPRGLRPRDPRRRQKPGLRREPGGAGGRLG